jgi:hypothetical protein
MSKYPELLKIIDLLRATDPESRKLGVSLFKKSDFIKQFQGNLSCLGFLFWVKRYKNQRNLIYMSYKELCKYIEFHPEVICNFVNNTYKAFLVIKNNRLLWQ